MAAEEILDALINKGVERMERMINATADNDTYWIYRKEYEEFVERFAEAAKQPKKKVEAAIMNAYEKKHVEREVEKCKHRS